MDLLELIAKLLGCRYLSDLHYTVATPAQLEMLNALVQADFSLEQYNQAASYIGDCPTRFETTEQARQAIVEHLLSHTNE
ncbi:MAG: hypothetical protein RR320_03480 [Oscillospiraceae bacterium]